MASIREAIEYDISQAEAGLKQLGATLNKAAASTDEVREAAHRSEGAVRRMEEGAGAAGSAMARLGGAADLLVPGLGNIVRSGADLADVLEVAGQAGGAAGLSMGTLLTVLGPIVAIVGTLGYAWSEANKREEEAAERARDHAEALGDLASAMRKVEAAQSDIDLRAGLVTGEYSQGDVDQERARKAAAGVTQAEREKVQEQLSAEIARQNTIRGQEQDRGFVDTFFGASPADLAREAHEVAANIKELEGRLKELDTAEATLASTTATTVGMERAAAERTKERSAATKEANTAEDAAQKAIDARAEAIRKATQTYQEAQDPLLAYKRRLEEIAALESAGALTGSDAAAARYTAAAQATAGSRDGGAGNAADEALQAAHDQKIADQEAAAAAAAQAAARKQYEDTLTSVSGIGNSVLGGDAVGALSSGLALAGPEGAAVGALLSGLSTLGEQGADQIAASLQAGLEGLISGIEELPDLISQLPGILQELIPELAVALVEAGPEIAWALVEAQAEMFASLPSLIGEALYEAFQRIVEQLKDVFQDPGEALFGGEDKSLGMRLRGAAVTTGRIGLAAATFGTSEVALGAANAASDGKVSDRLYGDGRGSERYSRSATRAAAHLVRTDRRADMTSSVPRNQDFVSAALTDTVRRSDTRLDVRSDTLRNTS